ETHDGYLWVATFSGVVRFDGIRFEPPVTTGEGRGRVALRDHVRCMFESADGSMWFGTRREGAVRLKDGHTEIFAKKDGLASNDVRAMAETKDGTVWFANAEGLASRDRTGHIRRYSKDDGLPANTVVTVYVDSADTLWVGTTDFGVARFDG